MSWSVVGIGEPAAAAAAALGLPHDAAGSTVEDRVVFVGTDGDLAQFALRVGPDVAILHAPPGRSDLGRMFGFTDQTVPERMEIGSRYRADLLVVRSGARAVPCVAHAVAARRGRIPSWMARRRAVSITLRGRTSEHRAAAVVVANAQHIGRRTVAPRAALMDGRAEVQVLGGSLRARMEAWRAMERGLHLATAGVHRRTFDRLELLLPPAWKLGVDGRPVEGTRWTVDVVPGAYTLWV